MKSRIRFLFLCVCFRIVFCDENDLEKMLDLTWPLDINPIAWPNNKKFTYTKNLERQSEDGSWYASNEYCAGEHGGTHLDAPYHFYQQGWKVDDIPIERFFAHGAVIDMTEEVNKTGRETLLTVKHLERWLTEHGSLVNNTVLLIRYGWSQYFNNYDAYMGEGATPSFPGMTSEAAQWLVDTKRIIGVGVDTASVDPGNSTSFDAHKTLSSNQIYGLENVNILEELPANGFSLVILPVKLKLGTGSPVRIVALPKIMGQW